MNIPAMQFTIVLKSELLYIEYYLKAILTEHSKPKQPTLHNISFKVDPNVGQTVPNIVGIPKELAVGKAWDSYLCPFGVIMAKGGHNQLFTLTIIFTK